jgi:hypothetical protein
MSKRKPNRAQRFPETGIERTSMCVPKGHRARCLKVAKAAVDKEYQTIVTETKPNTNKPC